MKRLDALADIRTTKEIRHGNYTCNVFFLYESRWARHRTHTAQAAKLAREWEGRAAAG